MAVTTLNGTAYAISYLHGKLEHRFTPVYNTSSLRGSFVVNHGFTLNRIYVSNWAHGSITYVHRLTKTDAVSNYAHGTVKAVRKVAKTDQQTNWLHGSLRTPVVHGLNRAINTIYSSGILTPTVVSYSTPEDRYAQLGYRPLNSLLVYVASALTPSDIAGIPNLGSFIIASSAYPTNATTFWNAGARPNYVGTVSSGSYFFRPPLDSEIVWQVTLSASGTVTPVQNLIYRDGAWLPFTTYAEKGIASQLQYISAQLDPLGAYQYFGQLLGNVMAELGQDNIDLSTMSDPDTAPARYLPAMADVMGVDITDPGIQTPEQRRRIKAAIPLHHAKGTSASISAAIAESGFVGYCMEIEVNVTNSYNWYALSNAPSGDVALATALGLTSVISPASGQKGDDAYEQAHGYSNADPSVLGYYPSSRMTLHLNNANGTPIVSPDISAINRVYRYLRQYALPACADIRYIVTDALAGSGNAGPAGGGGGGGNILYGSGLTSSFSGSTNCMSAAYTACTTAKFTAASQVAMTYSHTVTPTASTPSNICDVNASGTSLASLDVVDSTTDDVLWIQYNDDGSIRAGAELTCVGGVLQWALSPYSYGVVPRPCVTCPSGFSDTSTTTVVPYDGTNLASGVIVTTTGYNSYCQYNYTTTVVAQVINNNVC